MMIRTEEQRTLRGGQKVFLVKRSQNPHVILEDFVGKEIIVDGKYFRILGLGLADQHPDNVELSVRKVHLT
jgi:hypothetical protein